MRVVDVVDGNSAVAVGGINKLPIHRGRANSEKKVLLRIGLNAVKCGNSKWIAAGEAQGGRSGESRSPITIVDEENSSRQRTGRYDRGRTRGGNGKRSGYAGGEGHAIPAGNLWSSCHLCEDSQGLCKDS